MTKLGIVTIKFTHDSSDCETCGYDYEDSFEIEYSNQAYGQPARVGCFGRSSSTLGEVLAEFIKFNTGLEYEFDIFNDNINAVIKFLEDMGFEVIYNVQED